MNTADSGNSSTFQSPSPSFSSTNGIKYGGLIKRSFFKQIQKDLSQLIHFIYSVADPFYTVHVVITVLRIIQTGGPSLCSGYSDFWQTDEKSKNTISIISIFFFLIPPDMRYEGGFYFIIIYSLILFAILVLIYCSALYFKKFANLPRVIPQMIFLYFSTLGLVLHPITCEFGISRMSRLFFNDPSTQEIKESILLIIVSLGMSLIYFYIYIALASQSLIFQPCSLLTTTAMPTNLAFVSQIMTNALIALGEYAPPTARILFLTFAALLYFASALIPFCYGGFNREWQSSVYGSINITSGIICIVVMASIVMKAKATLVIPIAYLLIFIISVFVFTIVLKKWKTKKLHKLDLVVDDSASFDEIKSINQYLNMMIIGFSFCHPTCISWQFCKLGIERYPTNQWVWFVYAKLVCIYPEETQTLAWILLMIYTNKVHGFAAKTIKDQCLSIARQRETNLSADLKTKLTTASKHFSSAKHKLRHVWDLAIQGNTHDMESATKRAVSEINKCDYEVLHILRQFPNNRFVTRQYGRFCKEMKGDYATYNDMIERSRLLVRGIMVNKDQPHEYGVAAFDQLPDAKLCKMDQSGPGVLADSQSSQFDLEAEEENNQEADESCSLHDQINSLVIPGTCKAIAIRITIFIILYIIPVVALLVYSGFFIDSISKPLDHMHYFALARTYIFQLTAFSEQYLFEYFNYFSHPHALHNITTLGGSWNTNEQIIDICSKMTSVVQGVEEFRTFSSDSVWITKARSQIFDSSVKYIYFYNDEQKTELISVQAAIADLVLQARPIISSQPLSTNAINTSTFLHPVINAKATSTTFDLALEYIISYVAEKDKGYKKTVQLIIYIATTVVIVVTITEFAIEAYMIDSNKRTVYKTLTSLPKSVVSQLIENLRVLKKETEGSSTLGTSTEVNKQEDNITKIFAVGTSNSSSHGDLFLFIASTVLVLVLHVVSVFSLGDLIKNLSNNLRTNCPHTNYLQGTYANLIGAMSALNILVGFNYPETNILIMNKSYTISMYESRLDDAKKFYNLGRFGGSGGDEPPFRGYSDGIQNAKDNLDCPDQYAQPVDFIGTTMCYTADELLMMIDPLLNSYIKPYKQNQNKPLLDSQPIFGDIWELLIFPIYDVFIFPMSSNILTTIREGLVDIQMKALPTVVILLVVAFLAEILAVSQIISIQRHMKNVLKLFLLCPPKTILATQKIMAVISGDFSPKRNDFTTRNADFFKEVVSNLPNLIVICDIEQNITSVNKSITRILGLTEEDVKGWHIKKFFEKFKGNTDAFHVISSTSKSSVTENLVYTKIDGSEVDIEASAYVINQCFVLDMRDTTQAIRYNTLINEEKTKSDILLSSILPPSLVKRVQAGEKNISFAVQTATIVFMDIVSFTPWCGSLPADKVMSTLNYLFKKFDAVLSKYSSMTKIKCIGDCYMAAGGVFSEVNQPAEHAKEVTKFGLDSLDAVTDLDEELNEKLQIRVGVNTGGPLVAGVLGVGKPTFEILGPAINMAQQMEHHGVAMQVHISRSVYELIYGDTFDIKERGSIEIKNGSVITYLVSKKL